MSFGLAIKPTGGCTLASQFKEFDGVGFDANPDDSDRLVRRIAADIFAVTFFSAFGYLAMQFDSADGRHALPQDVAIKAL